MENIIKKAIEGGYRAKEKTIHNQIGYEKVLICDPLFWQTLGKSCGWVHKFYCDEGSGNSWYCRECSRPRTASTRKEHCEKIYLYYALRFHEINLTEGWSKAVEYLAPLTVKEK